jgi:type IV pilus assembly protein PilB
VTRLLDIGVPPYLVASSLNLVMAQRLVRVICPNCKEPYEPTEEEILGLGLTPEDLEGKTLYHGKGCSHCRNTGYYGRTGIFEILEMNSDIRRLIFDNANPEIVRDKALELGMETLRHSGMKKLLSGTTTVHEVLRVTIQDI